MYKKITFQKDKKLICGQPNFFFPPVSNLKSTFDNMKSSKFASFTDLLSKPQHTRIISVRNTEKAACETASYMQL